jgi:hypothetical protein
MGSEDSVVQRAAQGFSRVDDADGALEKYIQAGRDVVAPLSRHWLDIGPALESLRLEFEGQKKPLAIEPRQRGSPRRDAATLRRRRVVRCVG